MQATAVIKQFDIVEDRDPRLLAGTERAVPGELVLQVGEKALGDRIVPAVALATHACDHAMLIEHGPVGGTGVDHPLVRMVNESQLGPALGNRHAQKKRVKS